MAFPAPFDKHEFIWVAPDTCKCGGNRYDAEHLTGPNSEAARGPNGPLPPLPNKTATEGATREAPAVWQSGAKRSAPKLDRWLRPHKALTEVDKRFDVGKKYGVHNWKKAQLSDDLDYVRQFDSHAEEHLIEFFKLIDQPAGAVSKKGDDLIQNLAAAVWNYLALLEYLLENENLVRRAFSQYPEGDLRRFDCPTREKGETK